MLSSQSRNIDAPPCPGGRTGLRSRWRPAGRRAAACSQAARMCRMSWLSEKGGFITTAWNNAGGGGTGRVQVLEVHVLNQRIAVDVRAVRRRWCRRSRWRGPRRQRRSGANDAAETGGRFQERFAGREPGQFGHAGGRDRRGSRRIAGSCLASTTSPVSTASAMSSRGSKGNTWPLALRSHLPRAAVSTLATRR